MRVVVKLYGNLKKYLPEKRETADLQVSDGTTITALLAHLAVPDDKVWMSAINDTVVEGSTVLQDGDILEVFEPVGGGVGDSIHPPARCVKYREHAREDHPHVGQT